VGDAGHGILRYPRFALLPSPAVPSSQLLPTLGGTASCGQTGQAACVLMPTLALTQDSYGNLYVADGSNRVSIHYPAVATTNGASFLCAGECTWGGNSDAQYYLAPGVIASAFAYSGTQFVGTGVGFNNVLPVPTTVGGVQLLLNGLASPLFYVGTSQINFVVPWKAPTSGTAQLQVVQRSTGLILGSGTVYMNTVAPAMFTANSNGVGQIAALNHADGTVNSPSNPVARGAYIELYGTGQGAAVSEEPADGALPSGLVSTPATPQVFIGGSQVPSGDIQFSGLAPCCVGLWQINVQIPESTAPGNQVSLLVNYENTFSFFDSAHTTTIAVK